MTVDHLFEAQVARTPDGPAVRAGPTVSTYREMDTAAWRLAAELSRRGIGEGVRVGIGVDPGMLRGAAVLAVLRAGAAYVPLDPAYPDSRLRFMMRDADLASTLASPRHRSRLASLGSVLDIDELGGAADGGGGGRRSRARPDRPAYLLYTSGSTGRPKGVVMPHRALTNLIRWQLDQPGFGRPLRTLHFAPLGFDVHFQEMFATWCAGGELVYVDEAVRRDTTRLLTVIEEQSVERLFLPFVALQQLADVALTYGPLPTRLREVVTAGEQLVVGAALVEFFERLPSCRLHNQYGPTETHVVTSHTLEGPPRRWPTLPPIGHPIAGARIELLGPEGAPVPEGEEGELCVAGSCLADGYWRREELTEERFVPALDGRGRMYRTGDLGRRREDGAYDFLGRVDDQVKVRGHRVEPGEVEAAVRRHEAVREAAVWVSGAGTVERQLTAYLVLRNPAERSREAEELRRQHIAEWRRVWDGTYTREPPPQDGSPDLRGWRSSVTGEALPATEMALWVEGVVESVARHRPRRVLEIGCGSGLLLERLASGCDRFVGTDFSEVVIEQLTGRLEELGRPPSVELAVRTAHEIGTVEGPFDLIVVNSVIRYFPDLPYLLQVLRDAVGLLDEGGILFVGDVDSHPLREALLTSVVAHRTDPDDGVDRARAEVERRLAHDDELTVDPSFFWRLPEWLPRVGQVEVQLKPGRYENEVSRFRYDVTARVGSDLPRRVVWRDWSPSLEPTTDVPVADPGAAAVGLRGVPNARLVDALSLSGTLQSGGPTVREWLERAAEAAGERSVAARDPEQFRSGDTPGEARVSVSPSVDPALFDVVFHPPSREWRGVRPPSGLSRTRPLADLASRPLTVARMPQVVAELRRTLSEELPEYMIPDRWTLLARLPRTPSGKVDRRALPPPDRSRPTLTQDFEPPRGETETALASIWRDLLGLDRVGAMDSFFDLGGNSLLGLRMGVLVRHRLNRELPAVVLYENPTVRRLARMLDGEPPESDRQRMDEIGARARRQRGALTTGSSPFGRKRHGSDD